MKFLTLSLVATACLAADSSFKGKVAAEESDVSKEIKNYVNFDLETYLAGLKSQLVSLEEGLEKSPQELNRLEIDSMNLFEQAKEHHARCEMNVHKANLNLARLLKLKPNASLLPTFAAWKKSGFTGTNFMAVVKECLQHFPDRKYCENLKNVSTEWHVNTAAFLHSNGLDVKSGLSHYSKFTSIGFIYCGLTRPLEEHRLKFEKCIAEESFDGIRELARDIVISRSYSGNFFSDMMLPGMRMHDDNKFALLANAFNLEIETVWTEQSQTEIFNILQSTGLDADSFSKDIIGAYEQCILEAADNVVKQKKCEELVQNVRECSHIRKKLENLMNMFYGTSNSEFSFFHDNLVEPAIILINSKNNYEYLYDIDFLTALGVDSYEEALAQKQKLQIESKDLYNRLILIEKSREYLLKKNNFMHIRKDFDEMCKNCFDRKINTAYSLVKDVIKQLNRGLYPKCTFDMQSGMLMCKHPEFTNDLVAILQDKYACKILLDFCKDVIAEQSLRTAIQKYEAQESAHKEASNNSYKIVVRLDPHWRMTHRQ